MFNNGRANVFLCIYFVSWLKCEVGNFFFPNSGLKKGPCKDFLEMEELHYVMSIWKNN